ncbi:28S ribosomal protein S35, mitochondrial [Hylaeus volcanicus]|uniref:28S ribosomal protein S35, mitochondrial n=1 Tax=Hylaeus volcanicus TaxID=313075 RepID=UPI0023B8650A|nr:28S ribosomal protein S35, mitochondrial [Hylaeus volcanicus]
MITLIRHYEAVIQATSKIMKNSSFYISTNISNTEEFRVLELVPNSSRNVKRTKRRHITAKSTPRADRMPTDQNWQAIWPTARTFHPDTVPLPLRQGYKHNKHPHPSKNANAELMKIPNFLHLTPPAVKAHCEAIKKFCTKWPIGLETDEACEKHFPIEIITSDYCYSSPTIREPLARIVNLRVRLSSLHLDAHAKDKLLRLVGDRYNPKTGIITITADKCPTKKQNLDYVNYLLTALFHVSWRVEPWEAEKSEVDMEYYDWDKNKSRDSLVSMYSWPNPSIDCNYEDIPHGTEYKSAVSDLINNGEDHFSINKYKQAVKNVLNLNFNENVN